MEIWRNVVRHERKETHYGISGVAFADELEIDSISVEDVREEGCAGVNGYDRENSYDVLLLIRTQVMQRMLHDMVERQNDGHRSKSAADVESEKVKRSFSAPNRQSLFENGFVFGNLAFTCRHVEECDDCCSNLVVGNTDLEVQGTSETKYEYEI